MANKAFEILGIAPTDDGRAIRSAFLRIARIYHPDRFADMPDDVRSEAERRMKEATAAYESLRVASSQTPKKRRQFDEVEMRERAQRKRQEIVAKREREEHDRARWRRWEEAERSARERAEVEADMAAYLADEPEGGYSNGRLREKPKPTPLDEGERKRDPLAERLDAARRGETAPLVPQRAKKG
jgi:curved DNA-binding protein CbpA